ncbi:DUF1456 family protein [Aliiglaciecola sp. M165]|uniref:DUF1456 family protein n=1 Tax=Aliiglaciecola sp. M165 TaxID=2593649 RepID=UPI00117DEF9C|nr:DUF1456 family protein [Aliiglaciecola sp. M165]TRY32058.1 DUF1456 family protein [Aliiglaciecola sp. M165]
MNHNDVLRRLRFALSLDDTATINIFALADYSMEQDYLSTLMKKEQEPGFLPCRDKILSLFLDGLIINKRGKQEGVEPVVLKGSERLSNNDIMRKIRIAMQYRDDDIINLLKSVNFRMSKGELSALFRKPDHRNFKECGDQVVRNLLKGMVAKYRPESAKNAINPTSKPTKPTYKSKARPVKSDSQKVRGTLSRNKPTENVEEKPDSVWGKVKTK